MKVGIMAGVYYPEAGGSGTYLRRLRTDLLQAGHRVQIVCYGETPSEPGIARITRRLPIPIRLLVFGIRSLTLLRHSDVLFVNDYGLVAAILRYVFRKPALMKVIGDWAWESAVNNGLVQVDRHGDPLLTFQRRRQPLRAAVRKAIRTWAAQRMDCILVPSKYLAEVVVAWGVRRERVVVIYNGVAVDPQVATARRPADLIVTAARLVIWKGVDDLLVAVARLRRLRPNVRVRVLGEGPDIGRLRRVSDELGIGRAAEFVGQVSREQVRRELSSASVFALPSAYEGLPHVVLEAMATGCPVVAAAAGGTREVIRDGIDGLLVPYADPEALAAALARVLSDPALAVRLGAQGRERVAEAFAWAETRDAAIDLLVKLASRAPRASAPNAA